MLIFCRFHTFLGILIFIVHIVHSFVLLTANIDDVKKLAGKFVSESLAEKIAEFIAKATQHIITNVSEENVVTDQVSEENKQYNIARERKEIATDQISNADVSIASYEAERPEIEEKLDKMIFTLDKMRAPKSKFRNVKRQDTNIRYAKPKDRPEVRPESTKNINKPKPGDTIETVYKNHPARQYSYALESRADHQPKESGSKYIQKPKSTPVNVNLILDSTIGYAENEGNEEKHISKKLKSRLKQHRGHKIIEQQMDDNESYNNTNIDQKILRADTELTTERSRNEFDQYDNLNYPKAEFVATSGPVSLPKVPGNKKWFPDDRTDNEANKKYWF